MNSFIGIVTLGADPESIQLGEREGRKLRCAEKAPGKKAVTRWFNAIVTGRDVETADRLEKGNSILVTGQLVLTEYSPKKARYKGEKRQAEEMPFAKIMQVIKSDKFFGGSKDEEGSEAADGVTTTEDPIEGAGGVDGADDPLAGV